MRYRWFLPIWILLTAVTTTMTLKTPCKKVYDCDTCYVKKGCHWCPLDNKCHSDGVAFIDNALNPCGSTLSIYPGSPYGIDCPSSTKSYGVYDKELAYEQVFMAAVAYSEQPEVCIGELLLRQTELNADIEYVNHIKVGCKGTVFDREICAVVIALSHNRQSILVSFRGTIDTQQLGEIVKSIKLKPPGAELGKGKVYKYFFTAFNQFRVCLLKQIEKLHEEYPQYIVRFSGHSLGGTLASIAAYTYISEGILPKESVSLYTYGMPRVGSKVFAADHDETVENSFRIVHRRDCVPHLPPCEISCIAEKVKWPYQHRREIFYDVASMRKDSSFEKCHGNEDADCSHVYNGWVYTPWNALTGDCTADHKDYFNIPVGTYCDVQLGSRKRRSTALPENNLKEGYCSVIGSNETLLKRWPTALNFSTNKGSTSTTSLGSMTSLAPSKHQTSYCLMLGACAAWLWVNIIA